MDTLGSFVYPRSRSSEPASISRHTFVGLTFSELRHLLAQLKEVDRFIVPGAAITRPVICRDVRTYRLGAGIRSCLDRLPQRTPHWFRISLFIPFLSRGRPRRYTPRPSFRCAILCLERALESKMDSMNGQHGKQAPRAIRRDSQAGLLSVLLSTLASKRVVLDRQHGRNRPAPSLGSLTDSAK